MTPKEVQIEFESVMFMHQVEDYIDIYSKQPKENKTKGD